MIMRPGRAVVMMAPPSGKLCKLCSPADRFMQDVSKACCSCSKLIKHRHRDRPLLVYRPCVDCLIGMSCRAAVIAIVGVLVSMGWPGPCLNSLWTC
jgi:hypothetical protein